MQIGHSAAIGLCRQMMVLKYWTARFGITNHNHYTTINGHTNRPMMLSTIDRLTNLMTLQSKAEFSTNESFKSKHITTPEIIMILKLNSIIDRIMTELTIMAYITEANKAMLENNSKLRSDIDRDLNEEYREKTKALMDNIVSWTRECKEIDNSIRQKLMFGILGFLFNHLNDQVHSLFMGRQMFEYKELKKLPTYWIMYPNKIKTKYDVIELVLTENIDNYFRRP
jgi:hypothetical protein